MAKQSFLPSLQNLTRWNSGYSKVIDIVSPLIGAALGLTTLTKEDILDKTNSLKKQIDSLKDEEEKLNKKFVPIGEYHVLQDNEAKGFSMPKRGSCVPCFDILSKKNLERIENHRLKNYEMNDELKNCVEKRTQDFGAILAPKIIDGEIVHENSEKLKLILKGKNLSCFVLKRCSFYFGFPFGDHLNSETRILSVGSSTSDDEISISQPVSQEIVSDSGFRFCLKLATVFGDCDYTLPSKHIRNIEVPTIMKFSREAPAWLLLKKSFHRGMLLSQISDKTANNNQLLESIRYLAEKNLEKNQHDHLSQILDYRNKDWQNFMNSETESQKVKSFFDKIAEKIQCGLQLEVSTTTLQKFAITVFAAGGAGVGYFLAGPGWFLFETLGELSVAGALGLSGGGGCAKWLFTRNLGHNNSYYVFLKTVVTLLLEAYKKRHLIVEKKLEELHDLLKLSDLYHLERALSLMYDPDIGVKNFEGCELEKLNGASNVALINRIKCIGELHKLRKILATQCFIGVIGPQDAGKSTFVNKMWNCQAKTGINEHTSKTTLYDINDQIKVIDFPGQNSFEEYSQAFGICGSMNNIIVVVLHFTGDVSKMVSDELKNMYSAVAESSDSRIIICINQCGNKLDDLTEYEVSLRKQNATITNPMADLKSKYISKLNKYFLETDPLMELTLDEENVFFTDWKLDTNSRDKFGIAGIEEIKEALKKSMIDLGAIKSDATDELDAAFRKLPPTSEVNLNE